MKFKICLGGSKRVGKSSLIARFVDNTFDERTQSTLGVAFKRKLMKSEEIDAQLTIWDFGGEEKYRSLFPDYIQGSNAALLLYDITRKESLQDIVNWVQILDANAPEECVKVLIGTKRDLENDRQVQHSDAEDFIKQYHFAGELLETSAKTGENVEKAFQMALEEILKRLVQKCPHCGKSVSKALKICRFCGERLADATPLVKKA